MAKYNYDKSLLKGLGVGPFLGEVKERNKHIQAAGTDLPKSVFTVNEVAAKLHPRIQFAKVASIKDTGDAKLFKLVPDADKGTTELAYFRAGQYVSFALELEDGTSTTRAYTICSGPKAALGNDSHYQVLIQKVDGGEATDYILNNWNVDSEILMSGPLGHFFYQDLRDEKHIIALAGGSGITPFISMANAVKDGIEDFKITILYGCRTTKQIMMKDELDKLGQYENVKIVYILSEEQVKGYENGFIDSEIIKKYAGNVPYSIYCCGPEAMYNFVAGEVNKLGLPKRLVRFEIPGETLNTEKLSNFPKENKGKIFKAKVLVRNKEFNVEISGEKTILRSLEKAGISVPADCRAGECGWCHSRLISGDVFCARELRRMADEKFGWIHPCCTFPTSDIEIEVFPPLV